MWHLIWYQAEAGLLVARSGFDVRFDNDLYHRLNVSESYATPASAVVPDKRTKWIM
jgi:hypothetical protein